MLGGPAELLRDFWYYALPGAALVRGRTRRVTLLGEPVLIGRTADGGVFALRDICPHRGIPLSYGEFDGREVSCAYHGWRFGTDGRCTAIPSLMPDQVVHLDRIGVAAYPCREVQGNIWVFVADGERAPNVTPPEPPRVPLADGAVPQIAIDSVFPCGVDDTAYGLMDPTHAAFVHTSWWWKKDARRLRPKEKRFEPAPLGWRMTRHRLSAEHRIYRLLGGVPTTEITYSLPGVRVEHIEAGRHAAVSLTALTPASAQETVVHQCLYWTADWLAPFRPVVRALARRFLEQDRNVVVKQQEGLVYGPRLMLVDDADTQAKWFAQVKAEWLRARAEGRPFENPVERRTLRWHS